jgi:hypothetical protein
MWLLFGVIGTMIVFELACPRKHLFEGWFRDGATFERQVADGEVDCPVCGSKKIKKALMAPNLANTRKQEEALAPKPRTSGKAALEVEKASKVRESLRELRRTVEENFDYVGGAFAEEARKIHYGEVEQRNIYGETSDEDASSLVDEGIKVSRIPWLRREDS